MDFQGSFMLQRFLETQKNTLTLEEDIPSLKNHPLHNQTVNKRTIWCSSSSSTTESVAAAFSPKRKCTLKNSRLACTLSITADYDSASMCSRSTSLSVNISKKPDNLNVSITCDISSTPEEPEVPNQRACSLIEDYVVKHKHLLNNGDALPNDEKQVDSVISRCRQSKIDEYFKASKKGRSEELTNELGDIKQRSTPRKTPNSNYMHKEPKSTLKTWPKNKKSPLQRTSQLHQIKKRLWATKSRSSSPDQNSERAASPYLDDFLANRPSKGSRRSNPRVADMSLLTTVNKRPSRQNRDLKENIRHTLSKSLPTKSMPLGLPSLEQYLKEHNKTLPPKSQLHPNTDKTSPSFKVTSFLEKHEPSSGFTRRSSNKSRLRPRMPPVIDIWAKEPPLGSSEGFHETLSSETPEIQVKTNRFGTKFNFKKINSKTIATQTSFDKHQLTAEVVPKCTVPLIAKKSESIILASESDFLKKLGLNDQLFSGRSQIVASQQSQCSKALPKSYWNDPIFLDSSFKVVQSDSVKADFKGSVTCQSSDIIPATPQLEMPQKTEKINIISQVTTNPTNSENYQIQDFSQPLSFSAFYNILNSQKIDQVAPAIDENTPVIIVNEAIVDKQEEVELDADEEQLTQSQLETFNEPETGILHGDNLIKELLLEKASIERKLARNKLKTRQKEEPQSVLAQTYIKKYKKGNLRIFKLNRRFQSNPGATYVPPEEQIMDNFIKKLKKGFEDSSSDESLDGRVSVGTPGSYKTDETKSEVLSTGSEVLTDAQKILREGINRLSKDKSLLFSRWSDVAPEPFDKHQILIDVQTIICKVLNDYEQGGLPRFEYQKTGGNVIFENNRYQKQNIKDRITITRNTAKTRQRFNLHLFILNKVRTLLETNTKLSKREIYYLLKGIFNSQQSTDQGIHVVSLMLNVGPWALNITAHKGLVYGNLNLVMENGETVNCNVPTGTLIPHSIEDICEIQSDAYFILIVEKEAIFHKLLEENLPKRLTRPFILATGKGYADLNTQRFLKKLWMVMTIPVFILVDADPHGISIMLNYRFGSVANAHVSEHLAIPKAKWIGVFPSDIKAYKLEEEPLNERDEKKVKAMLQMDCVKCNPEIQNELKVMLKNGVKAGIETLIKRDNYLSHRYLGPKFYMNRLI